MQPEKIIIAHSDKRFREALVHDLSLRRTQAEIRHTAQSAQVLALQASFVADAVLLDMELRDVPPLRVVQMLKRDVGSPYVLAVAPKNARNLAAEALKLGANAFVSASQDAEALGRLIDRALTERGGRIPERAGGVSPEETLQQMFCTLGIPFSLGGYTYLRCALRLIASGEAVLKNVGLLYRKIGVRFQCSPDTVESAIHYAIKLAWQRLAAEDPAMNRKPPSNKRFLALLVEHPSGVPVQAPQKGVTLLRNRREGAAVPEEW